MGTGRAASLTTSLPLQPRHGGRAALTPARDSPGDGGGCTVPGMAVPEQRGMPSQPRGALTCHRVPVQVVEHVAHTEDAGGRYPGPAEGRRLAEGGGAVGVLAGRRGIHPARQGLHLALGAPAAAAPLAVLLLLLVASSEPPAAARAAAGGAVAFQAHHGLREGIAACGSPGGVTDGRTERRTEKANRARSAPHPAVAPSPPGTGRL